MHKIQCKATTRKETLRLFRILLCMFSKRSSVWVHPGPVCVVTKPAGLTLTELLQWNVVCSQKLLANVLFLFDKIKLIWIKYPGTRQLAQWVRCLLLKWRPCKQPCLMVCLHTETGHWWEGTVWRQEDHWGKLAASPLQVHWEILSLTEWRIRPRLIEWDNWSHPWPPCMHADTCPHTYVHTHTYIHVHNTHKDTLSIMFYSFIFLSFKVTQRRRPKS